MMAAYPKIYYALVARERIILCDGGQDGFEQSSQAVLERPPQSINMKTYTSSRHVYHVMVSGGLKYLCVTDKCFDCQIAFALLREMEHQIISNGLREKANYVGPYGLRFEFGSKITPLLKQYSSRDKMNHLQDKVSEVTGIMSENIEKVICKGEKLEDLTDRTTVLSYGVTDFRNEYLMKKLKDTNRRAKTRTVITIVIILLVITFLFLIIAAATLIALKLTGHLK